MRIAPQTGRRTLKPCLGCKEGMGQALLVGWEKVVGKMGMAEGKMVGGGASCC